MLKLFGQSLLEASAPCHFAGNASSYFKFNCSKPWLLSEKADLVTFFGSECHSCFQSCEIQMLIVLVRVQLVAILVPDDMQDCFGILRKNLALAFYSGPVLTTRADGSPFRNYFTLHLLRS